jgi:uncharacterized protein YggE
MSRTGMVIGIVGLVLVAVLLAIQLLGVVPGAGTTVSGTEPTGLSVVAQGTATGKPDLAMITLGVETRDPEAKNAAEQNDQQMAQVMSAFTELGIAEEDIQTVDYSIRAEIDYSNNEQRLLGYVVTNSVQVKIRDMSKVGAVLDAATGAGANNVYGIQFTFEDPSALREQARTEAMSEARKKADALAQLAGVGVGRPRYISESFVEPPIYAERAAVAPAVGGGVTPVSAGQLEVTVQVQVTYEIR